LAREFRGGVKRGVFTDPVVASAIEQRPLKPLISYGKNPRTHSPAQVTQIVASIREFGFTNPF
jgi:ParB-like chromosome segregation protein Spo0J